MALRDGACAVVTIVALTLLDAFVSTAAPADEQPADARAADSRPHEPELAELSLKELMNLQ